MELKIVKVEQGVAIFNYEELKQELQVNLQKYKGYVFDEAQIAVAKADRAGLNKLSKAIADKRKETKNIILEQFNKVAEPQFKELEAMVNECSQGIDSGIKAQEEKEKAQKLEETLKLWQTLGFDLIPFETVFVEQWVNKTYSMAKIKDDMTAFIEKVNNDLKLIEQFGENIDTLKARYLNSKDFDVTRIISEANEEKKVLEALIKESKSKEQLKQVNQPETVEKQLLLRFEVKGTRTQLLQIIYFMKSLGVHAKNL